ncbi:DUF483 domain-containing protein [Buttiauxella sp. S04-F03]|uniref:DUF483 domain-containing protein n=1 Tax=Buttiauxella sp. S04-F03 TaxID=2904525 RepID=UPI001E616879|nr:DUF483 domain-containing protein [Buttiauxella sp. S04-F03]MCE0814781.1 DUF483 domain-containing protein [Buttiauxella sp. S04-F03]
MEQFNLQAFASSPSDLPKSAYVDLLLFVSDMKPAIRIGVLDDIRAFKLFQWATGLGYFSKIDDNGFVFVSKVNNVEYLIKVDQSYLDHTEELGTLLGYPICCIKSISKVGESNIDSYEENVVYNWEFENDFQLINPKLYYQGCSLISHIPCTPTCIRSLSIARKALSIVKNNQSHHRFLSFKQWLLH